MSREDMTDEKLERLLRDHFEEEYGEARQPAELWRALQSRLDHHEALDILPPPRVSTAGTPTPAKPNKSKSNVDGDWLPLPKGVKPTRLQRRPSLLPFALVACLVLGVVLAAYLLVRSGQLSPVPVAHVPAEEQTVAVASPTVGAPSPQGNLIIEMGASDWLLLGDDRYMFQTRVDRTETYNGSPSAYLTPSSSNFMGDAYLLKMVNKPDLGGKRVRFSAYVKSEGVRDHAEVWLVTADYLPKFGRTDGNLNPEIKGTTGWQRYEITQDVPAGSISISFGLRLMGQGKVWIEGAKLEEVGQDVPVLTTSGFVNGSFESGLAGWEASGTRDALDLDTDAHRDGSASLRMKGSKSLSGKQLPQVKQAIQLSGYAGQRVRVTAYIKTDKVSRWGTIYADLEDRTGKNASRRLAHDDLYTRPLPDTSDWNQYSIVMDVPQGNIVLTVGAFVDGGGTMWVDDVRIEPVGQEVALTGAQILHQPSNLDFESGLTTWLVGGTYPHGYEIGLDDKEVHGGKASAHIRTDPNLTGSSDSGGLEQWFDPSQFRNQRIRVSVHIKSDNVSRNVLFRLVAQSAELRSGNVAQLAEGTIYGRRDWQEYSLVVDVPRDSQYISLTLSLQGQGEVWFDDLKIEIVDRSVPLTGSPGGLSSSPLGSLQYRYELVTRAQGCI